jgi:hypothetical protein
MLRDGHRGSTPKPATPPYALAAHLESQKAFKIRPFSTLAVSAARRANFAAPFAKLATRRKRYMA